MIQLWLLPLACATLRFEEARLAFDDLFPSNRITHSNQALKKTIFWLNEALRLRDPYLAKIARDEMDVWRFSSDADSPRSRIFQAAVAGAEQAARDFWNSRDAEDRVMIRAKVEAAKIFAIFENDYKNEKLKNAAAQMRRWLRRTFFLFFLTATSYKAVHRFAPSAGMCMKFFRAAGLVGLTLIGSAYVHTLAQVIESEHSERRRWTNWDC